jgi:cytochrome oxidase Cu insertion factor (SCO1/SenC/PrrC family)
VKSRAPADTTVKRGRLKLLLMAAFFAAPVLLAWLAYRFDWATGTSGNYGVLLKPAAPPDAALSALDGRPFSLARLRGKWVLVQFDGSRCDAYCERKLYFMRQVRKALGRDAERVERLWVLTDPGVPSPKLLAAAEGTRVARAANGRFLAAFPAEATPADHIYLVDPMGNLMMRFPREPDPSRMLKDLQRLLKYSQVG